MTRTVRSALPDNYMKVTAGIRYYTGLGCRYTLTSGNTTDLHQVPEGPSHTDRVDRLSIGSRGDCPCFQGALRKSELRPDASGVTASWDVEEGRVLGSSREVVKVEVPALHDRNARLWRAVLPVLNRKVRVQRVDALRKPVLVAVLAEGKPHVRRDAVDLLLALVRAVVMRDPVKPSGPEADGELAALVARNDVRHTI